MKAAFFWKTMLVVIHAKILHHFSSTVYENFKLFFFYLSSVNENLETYTQVWFEQLKELKQFWGTFSGEYLNKCTLSQKCKISCSLKTTTCSHTIFIWLSFVVKQLLEKFNFEFLHAFNFSCTWNREATSCR